MSFIERVYRVFFERYYSTIDFMILIVAVIIGVAISNYDFYSRLIVALAGGGVFLMWYFIEDDIRTLLRPKIRKILSERFKQ